MSSCWMYDTLVQQQHHMHLRAHDQNECKEAEYPATPTRLWELFELFQAMEGSGGDIMCEGTCSQPQRMNLSILNAA